MLWRVHHCIGDGRSLAWAFFNLTDEYEYMLKNKGDEKKESSNKGKENIKKENEKKPKVARTNKPTLAQSLSVYIKILWKLTCVFFIPEPKTIFKYKGNENKKIAWNTSLKVSEIKNVGKNYQATVNDIIVC